MIRYGWFRSHSGLQLPWKIELDGWPDFVWQNVAQIVYGSHRFSEVVGVPTGGLKLAHALEPLCEPGYGRLIVDDVLTTGASMEALREDSTEVGVVVYARGPYPSWVKPIFTVSEWAQNPFR